MSRDPKYIPRHLLLSAEIRSITDLDIKAATICYKDETLKLTRVVEELGANYHRSWTRLKALEDRGGWTPRGRPPLIQWQHRDEIHHNIARSYYELEAMTYKQLQNSAQSIYKRELLKLTPDQQEKKPATLPPGYCYTLAKRFEIHATKPIIGEKDRNKAATTQTIQDFFNHTYTSKMAEGVPEDMIFNADETHAEIGNPEKVLVPEGAKGATSTNPFDKNLHITAMVPLNAAGDSIPPFIILPLKYLPKNMIPFIARNQVLIGGTSNGYMTDDAFEHWSKWFIQYIIDLRAERSYAKDQRAILFLDGHVTRNNKKVMQLFHNTHIDVIIFPPHLTHLIQPFDTTLARPLKKALKAFAQTIYELLSKEEQSVTSLLRLAQVIAIIDACTVARTITNCRVAFKSCGLFPRNANEVLSKKGVRKSSKSFIDFSTPPASPIKISGRCITQDEVLHNLREIAEKKSSKNEKTSKKPKKKN